MTKKDPSLAFGKPELANLRDSLDATTKGDFYTVATALKAAETMSSSEKISFDSHRLGIKARLNDLKNLSNLTNPTAADNQLKAQAIADLQTQETQLKAFLQAYEQAKQTEKTAVKQENATLPSVEVYEANTKTVTDIYLSTVAKHQFTFNNRQTQALTTIANQCPLSGGPSVYQARALYNLKETKVYNDKALCNAVGVNWRKAPKTSPNHSDGGEQVRLFPNPAQNYAVLQRTLGDESDDNIQIIDALGRIVYTGVWGKGLNQYQINTSDLVNGLYSIRINTETVLKLSVVK